MLTRSEGKKMSLHLTKYHAFLTLALDGGAQTVLHPGSFIPGNKLSVPT